MKNYYYLLITILLHLAFLPLSAQHNCGTITKSDPVVEYILSQNLENFNLSDSIAPIPIQFHVTRPSDGINGFEPRFIDSIIQVLNLGFAGSPFSFYACSDINYIDDDEYATLYHQSSSQDLDALFNFHNSDIAINAYLANAVFGLNVGAWAYYPWGNNHTYVIPFSGYNSNTHIHEMGHLMGLYHTHESGELVDGSNCETHGDLCCDTPAEPTLSGLVDGNCEYTGNAVDANGQLYIPDVGNHMSYARSPCRTFFSQDQIERMQYFYYFYLRKFQCDEDFKYTDVSIDEITTSPYPAVENEPYSIIVNLRNSGNIQTGRVTVDINMDGIDLGRKNTSNIYTNLIRGVAIPDRVEFPHEAGRHLICAEVEGDSLEINDCNQQFCQEILIRQAAGIPDLAISNPTKGLTIGNINALNPLSFNLENLGNITAEEVAGKVFVRDVLVDSFTLADIAVAEQLTVNLTVPLNHSINEVCIEMEPAFTEERLDNNGACIIYTTQDSLISDLEIDSISLVPDDALMIPGKIYQLFYRHKNNGPAIAWNNKSYLLINSDQIDSTIFNPSWGWSPGNIRLDSFHFIVPWGSTSVDICAEVWQYRDTLLSNNTLCLSRPVEQESSLEEYEDLAKLKLYPNPVEHVLNIDASHQLQTVIIYDNLGSPIITIDALDSKKKSINVKQLKAGIYHLVIETDKQKIYKTVVKI